MNNDKVAAASIAIQDTDKADTPSHSASTVYGCPVHGACLLKNVVSLHILVTSVGLFVQAITYALHMS